MQIPQKRRSRGIREHHAIENEQFFGGRRWRGYHFGGGGRIRVGGVNPEAGFYWGRDTVGGGGFYLEGSPVLISTEKADKLGKMCRLQS